MIDNDFHQNSIHKISFGMLASVFLQTVQHYLPSYHFTHGHDLVFPKVFITFENGIMNLQNT